MKLLKISLLALSATTFAQVAPTESTRSNGLSKASTKSSTYSAPLNYNARPAFRINGQKYEGFDLSFLNPDNIASLEVFKGQKAVELYGKDAEAGFIDIKTKAPVKILDYYEIAKKYNLNPELKFVVNKSVVADSGTIKIDESLIADAKNLTESPFAEPKIPHLPGEKMNYITLKK